MNGVARDVPRAAMLAMWNHATAVRAHWHRQPTRSLHGADLLVRAFARTVEVAGPIVPGFSTRMITLAGAYDIRIRLREPGDPELLTDLRLALDTVEPGLTADGVPTDMLLRGHRLYAELNLAAPSLL